MRYIMLLEDFYLIISYKVKDRGRLVWCTGSLEEISKKRLYWIPVEKARQGPAESFPTQTGLKLNALRHRLTRVEAAGGERLSRCLLIMGWQSFPANRWRGKREVGTSAGPLLIVYFGPVSLNTPERLLFLPDDLWPPRLESKRHIGVVDWDGLWTHMWVTHSWCVSSLFVH